MQTFPIVHVLAFRSLQQSGRIPILIKAKRKQTVSWISEVLWNNWWTVMTHRGRDAAVLTKRRLEFTRKQYCHGFVMNYNYVPAVNCWLQLSLKNCFGKSCSVIKWNIKFSWISTQQSCQTTLYYYYYYYYFITVVIIILKIVNARPGESAWHPIRPKTQAQHYQPIEIVR